MKKLYHYLYSSEDSEEDHPDVHDLELYEADQNEAFRDVFSFLDQQVFDVNKSVVQDLVEYAGKQVR
jgi:hypothetical protein